MLYYHQSLAVIQRSSTRYSNKFQIDQLKEFPSIIVNKISLKVAEYRSVMIVLQFLNIIVLLIISINPLTQKITPIGAINDQIIP